jgi:hypothetical protein
MREARRIAIKLAICITAEAGPTIVDVDVLVADSCVAIGDKELGGVENEILGDPIVRIGSAVDEAVVLLPGHPAHWRGDCKAIVQVEGEGEEERKDWVRY